MDKNTIFAIVLSTLVIVGGFTIQAKFFPTTNEPQAQKTVLPSTTTAKSSNTTSVITDQTPVEDIIVSVPTDASDESLNEETFVIDTKLASIKFTNRGGDIVSYKLKAHTEREEGVEMAEFVTDKNRAFSLLLGDANGTPVDQLFKVKKINEYSIGFYRSFSVKNQDGSTGTFTLVKQYTFLPDDYMFDLQITVDGDSSFQGLQFGQAAYTIKTPPQIGPQWNAKQDKYEYRRFYHLLAGKKKTTTLNAGQTKLVNESVTWAGVGGKYFTLIALPSAPLQSVVYSAISPNADTSASQIFLTRSFINASRNTDSWKFYIGPRTEKYLTKYNTVTNNPWKLSDTKIDMIVESSGILGPLEVVLKWLMEFFYKIIPNWGVSIIILTILMRIVLFPLTKKSSESTLKMQELQPKIQEIQTKYKDNSAKMNEEMAKFYKTAGYNPMSGCLPLLIQFPLIFAMYNLFNNYFEFRGAMFIPGWIPDLSQGDSVMNLPFTVPFLGWTVLRILPVIYVISQLLFGKVTQTPTSSQQNSSMKMMMYGMPIFFFFIFYNAPAGLLIYWTFSNILTLGQQVLINKMMHSKKNKKNSVLKLVK